MKLLNTWLVNIAGGQQQAVVHYYRRLVARDLVYGDVLSCSFDIGVLLYLVDICTGIMFFGLWIKMFVSEGGERRMCSVCAMSAYA